MRKFQFGLEALLRLRRIQKEQSQIKLAAAVNRLRREQELLAELQGKLSRNLVEFRTFQEEQATVPIDTLKVFDDFFDKIKRAIVEKHEHIAQAEVHRQTCLAALTETAKQCKIVEKLREKRLQQYYGETLREEQKQLDEMGSQIFAREV